MPAYILLLIAVVPVLAMVATAGNALGRDAQLAAVIAFTITLFGVIAWLVVGTVRTVLEIWRRVSRALRAAT
jgi:small basic protein